MSCCARLHTTSCHPSPAFRLRDARRWQPRNLASDTHRRGGAVPSGRVPLAHQGGGFDTTTLLNLMCAPFNNRDFKCECTHGRHDGRAVERPTTMAQRSPRALRNDDWFESCYICYSPDNDGDADNDSDEDNDEANATTKLGPLLCCNECPRVAHKNASPSSTLTFRRRRLFAVDVRDVRSRA